MSGYRRQSSASVGAFHAGVHIDESGNFVAQTAGAAKSLVLLLRLIADDIETDQPKPIDDEEFCARCFAGVDSSEHHEKCVVPGFAEDGESAEATKQGDSDE